MWLFETLRLAQNLQVSSSRCFDRELEKIKIIENEDMFKKKVSFLEKKCVRNYLSQINSDYMW
jgi:hypothetical protein